MNVACLVMSKNKAYNLRAKNLLQLPSTKTLLIWQCSKKFIDRFDRRYFIIRSYYNINSDDLHKDGRGCETPTPRPSARLFHIKFLGCFISLFEGLIELM